jgi:predicted metal-dependent enzyme (double-stranded beta helix superfamily)
MTSRTITPAIAELSVKITSIVRRDDMPAIDTARLVADALGGVLGHPDLLTSDQQRPRSDCYCQHVLYVDPDGAFSIVALVWQPGQGTPIHDHISWCVVGVHAGAEEETLYRLVENGLDAPHLVQSGHAVNAEGTTSYFVPPGDIHAVRNSSERKAISIHVYGADIATLGTSLRRRYDLPVLAG